MWIFFAKKSRLLLPLCVFAFAIFISNIIEFFFYDWLSVFFPFKLPDGIWHSILSSFIRTVALIIVRRAGGGRRWFCKHRRVCHAAAFCPPPKFIRHFERQIFQISNAFLMRAFIHPPPASKRSTSVVCALLIQNEIKISPFRN